MVKRTPQEIADIFQCFVAEDRDYNVFKLYKKEPKLNPPDCIYDWDGDSFAEIDSTDINVPPEHVLSNIYAPKSAEIREQIMNQIEEKTRELERAFESSYKEIFSIIPKTLLSSVGGAETEQTTKAPHQSEVHTHREYRLIEAHKGISPEAFSKGVMFWIERGWKPCGGIAFNRDGCPYQAIVRGV